MIKKSVAVIIIIVALVFGITFTGLFYSEGIFSLVALFLFAFPMFLLGQWLRIGSREFKKTYIKLTTIFVQVTFLIPSIFLLFNEYSKMKNGIFLREGFLWFQSTSSPSVGMIGTLLLIVLVLSLMPKILFGWSYGGKTLTLTIVATVISSAIFLFVTWNDYKGIHETEGIIVSKWTENENTVSWSRIEKVEIIPFVKKRVSSKYSREPVFAWRFEFQSTTDDKITFEQLDLSEFNLKQSTKVKQHVKQQSIPISVEPMDESTKKWYNVELDIDKLDRTKFDELFSE